MGRQLDFSRKKGRRLVAPSLFLVKYILGYPFLPNTAITIRSATRPAKPASAPMNDVIHFIFPHFVCYCFSLEKLSNRELLHTLENRHNQQDGDQSDKAVFATDTCYDFRQV